MRTAISIVLALALAAICGCQTSSPGGGGASKEEGFRISVPSYSTTIKQGEVQNVAVSLQRGDYFKQDVTLEVKPSEGITVDPDKVVVKASDKPEVQLRVAAAKNAAIGQYRVYVKGSPDTGEPASTEFSVNIVAP